MSKIARENPEKFVTPKLWSNAESLSELTVLISCFQKIALQVFVVIRNDSSASKPSEQSCSNSLSPVFEETTLWQKWRRASGRIEPEKLSF